MSCLRENLTSSSYGEGLETAEAQLRYRASPLPDNENGVARTVHGNRVEKIHRADNQTADNDGRKRARVRGGRSYKTGLHRIFHFERYFDKHRLLLRSVRYLEVVTVRSSTFGVSGVRCVPEDSCRLTDDRSLGNHLVYLHASPIAT